MNDEMFGIFIMRQHMVIVVCNLSKNKIFYVNTSKGKRKTSSNIWLPQGF
jgi:hypothetical protein